MSVVTFELTDKHILALRKLKIDLSFTEDKFGLLSSDDATPADIYEELNLIFYGKTEDTSEFDADVEERYGKEKVDEFHKIMIELPKALDIILYTGKFEPGIYKTKFHVRDWKKVRTII